MKTVEMAESEFGSANGNRTRRLAVQASPVRAKWLFFQSSWYSGMVQNTATDRRRHSAVTARSWAEGAAEAVALRKLPHSNLRVPVIQMHDPASRPTEPHLREGVFLQVACLPNGHRPFSGNGVSRDLSENVGGGGYYGFDSRRRVVDHGSKHPSELRFSFVKALLGAVGTNMQSARSGLNGGKRSVVVNKYVRYYTKQKRHQNQD